MPPSLRPLLAALLLCSVWSSTLGGRPDRPPSARLIRAPRIAMPGAVDSNVPLAWELVDGRWLLFALTSWGGVPERHVGVALDQMQPRGPVDIRPHPGHGVWIESIVRDDGGTWYGYYHHERIAERCGRGLRAIPRIGAVRSADRGATWEHLGFVLEAPPETTACESLNQYVVGGVGDLSAILDRTRTNLFLFVTQYVRNPADQGIAVARLAWTDRDHPVGRVMVWRDGAWLPPRQSNSADPSSGGWAYPIGTPLIAPTRPWHDGQIAADGFWGPSVHWNRYLERYVMLMSRAANEYFRTEGIYASFAARLDDPRLWSTPRKILDRGGWYPQVAGLEPTTGTDREAGQRARFLLTGRSDYFIEFER